MLDFLKDWYVDIWHNITKAEESYFVYQKKNNNPLKVYSLNKKYLIIILTPPTQIVTSILIIEKPGFNGVLKINGVQNQLPITFCSDLVCNKTLNAQNSTPIRTKSDTKVVFIHFLSYI